MNRKPEDCRDMGELRTEIDRIDDSLVTLFAERETYIHRAVEIKKIMNIPALVPERVEAVINHVRQKATMKKLNVEFAEMIWRAIIDWAVKLESEKLK